MSELAVHDITVTQPYQYITSYLVSIGFLQVSVIELLRAYNLLKERHSEKEMQSIRYCHEKKLMHVFWTEGLKKSEINKGNTYLVRERARWSLI